MKDHKTLSTIIGLLVIALLGWLVAWLIKRES